MTRPGRRRGATLVELVVALTLTAVVLGAAASSVLRQHRTARVVSGEAATTAQLRAATGALSAELSVLSRAAGDIVPGEARDSALELRSLVAAGVACDDAVGSATFAPDDDGVPEALWGTVPRVGDSLWWYRGGATAAWHGARIATSDSVSAPCLLTGSALRPARRVAVAAGGDTIPFGAPLRVTRPARYSFYRSGDGSWQLGVRDWIGDHFGAPQPLAGPFLVRAGDRRSGFRYFAPNGDELSASSAGVNVDQVARIRVTVLTPDPSAAGMPNVVRADSIDVALLPVRSP
ncbi:MAG TPA: prepilin-type N-terminal cleavage/methylation domain-containing protein [Gemmatimonadaceae bacterium]|nr:prepilin-type N-terminal cleavage/methylation domain-containing protein [Gemmatimonadaceae bacterium]